MKAIVVLFSAAVLTASVVQGQNLLLNADFNSPGSITAPDDWTIWTYGGGYANHELISPAPSVQGIYDNSYQMTIGAANTSGGGGVYQVVAATAGTSYTLGVDAGAQNWWLPTGQIRIFFLDSGNNQLAETQINSTDGIHSPDQYDTGVAYQHWTLNAIAPIGTTQAKVELAGYGGGSCWFDNAVLTAAPEPSVITLAAGAALALIRFSRRNKNA